MSTELYSCLEVERIPFGRDLELVYSPISHSIQVLPTVVVTNLLTCQPFATIDDHALRLSKGPELRQESLETIRNHLKKLAENRLLIAQGEILRRIEQARAHVEDRPRITTVGIPTRNRTVGLQLALVSCIENLRKHGRTIEFVVVDDSDLGARAEQNRELLLGIKRQYGIDIFYANREDRAQFAKKLIELSGLAGDTVEFALLNRKRGIHSAGACWNALLLQTVGELLLCLSDETACQLIRPPGFSNNLKYTSRFDPTECWFYRDDQIPSDVGCIIDQDFLGTHEKLLGRTVGNCLVEWRERRELDLGDVPNSRFWKSGLNERKISATTGTCVGDCCITYPSDYFFLEGASLHRLLQGESEYRHALTSRNALRATNRMAICTDTFLNGGNMGLDNRNLLPPFLPIDSDADSVFAGCLTAGFESTSIGFLPWALRNAPFRQDPSTMDSIWKRAAHIRVEEIFRFLISSWQSTLFPIGMKTDRERLCAMGRYFAGMASIPLQDFAQFIRVSSIHLIGTKLRRIQKRIQECGGKPEYWDSDLRKYFRILRDAIAFPDNALPQALSSEVLDEPESMSDLRDFFANTGRLFEIWPEILDTVKEMRLRGWGLARRI